MRKLSTLGLTILLLAAGRVSAWGTFGCRSCPVIELPEPTAVWYGWGAPAPEATLVPAGDPLCPFWVPGFISPEQTPTPSAKGSTKSPPAKEPNPPATSPPGL